jgi:hypothetical protein
LILKTISKITNSFLDEGVRKKFRRISNHKKEFLKIINEENLPIDYGGKAPKISDF